jgi:nucleoside phosphorylase
VSDQVLDYEGARLDVTGPKKRPLFYIPDIRVRRDVRFFHEHKEMWHKRFSEGMRILRKHKVRLPKIEAKWTPSFDEGVILAGEKLIGDGSLPPMREEYHDKVRAGEMEGSGFARACEEYGIPWLVFRGISDFGDPEGSETRKEWKAAAALASATAVVHFLDDAFRQAKDQEF